METYIELIKTTPWSLNMVYKEAQKFNNIERERELKSSKGLLIRTTDKPIPTKREEEKKPYGDKRPNSPRFKLLVTSKGSLGYEG